MLGPPNVKDGSGAALLPAAEAVVEPEDVGEALGVAEDLARRVLDDRGNLWAIHNTLFSSQLTNGPVKLECFIQQG